MSAARTSTSRRVRPIRTTQRSIRNDSSACGSKCERAKMKTKTKLDRRGFLTATAGVVIATPMLALAKETGLNPDEGVTAPEDLMKEHGVLNRCLLIYEEGMRRLQRPDEISPEVFHHTAQL